MSAWIVAGVSIAAAVATIAAVVWGARRASRTASLRSDLSDAKTEAAAERKRAEEAVAELEATRQAVEELRRRWQAQERALRDRLEVCRDSAVDDPEDAQDALDDLLRRPWGALTDHPKEGDAA